MTMRPKQYQLAFAPSPSLDAATNANLARQFQNADQMFETLFTDFGGAGGDGEAGPPGPPGASGDIFIDQWTWIAAATAPGATIGASRVAVNTDNVTLATTFLIHKLAQSSSGPDWSPIFSTMVAGDRLYFQKKGTAPLYNRYTLTGVPVLNGGTTWAMPVVWNSGTGEPANGVDIMVGFQRLTDAFVGPPGPAGPAGPPGPGGGALVLLEQHTAAGSAQLDFTTGITAAYDEYQIELINVTPVGSAVNLLCRVSTTGGATYDSTANYFGAVAICANNLGVSTTQVNAATSAQLYASVDPTLAWGGVSGTLKIFNPLSASIRFTMQIHLLAAQATSASTETGMALWNLNTAVNALRFFFSSGNIATGTIRLYGVAK